MNTIMRATVKRMTLIAIMPSVLLSGCAMFDFLHSYKDISEAPKEGGVPAALQTRTSTIQPVVNVPLSLIQSAGNQAASKVLPINKNGRENISNWELRDPIFHGCIICASLDADWEYSAGLFGQITVTGQSNKLWIGVPARIDGKVGLAGDIARLLSLNGKSFKAGVDARFGSGFGADSRFCPKVRDVSIEYNWTDGPSFEIIGKSCLGDLCVGPWNYDLRPHLEPEIRKAIQQVEGGLNNNLPCDPMRTELQKIWWTRNFPIILPYADKLYLNIEPVSLHIPDVGIDQQQMSIAGRLEAKVSVDIQPIPEKPLELPPNTPAPVDPGRFSLAIPVSTKYYTLQALAKQQVVGRKFSTDTPLGSITVRPKAVRIYPSDNNIAIGMPFVLDYEYKLFNTSGTIWFAGQPESTNNGKAIRIHNIKVTRKFDNPIWSVASVLLEGKVQEAIADGFLIDLTKPLSDAENQLMESVNRAGDGKGFQLHAHDASIAVGRILTTDAALQVEGLLDAVVDATMSLPQP